MNLNSKTNTEVGCQVKNPKVFKVAFLSDNDLLSRFGKLVQTERKITHLVLECIAEIDSRRLYLDKAYPSLYEFLVQEFGYSSSAALRRIESARLLREVPEVAAKIESGALNLSQLSKVQQAIRTVQKVEDRKLESAEKKELLSRIEYTTQQQTEVILSQALSLPVIVEDKEKAHRDESVTLTITFSKEQMEILRQAQDLIAHAVPEKKWAEALTYLAQKEVNRRTQIKRASAEGPRLTKTRSSSNAKSPRVESVEMLSKESESIGSHSPIVNRTTTNFAETKLVESKPTEAEADATSPAMASTKQVKTHSRDARSAAITPATGAERRPLSARTKKTVLNQQRCCQYSDPTTGRICGGTRFLQADHRHSVWAGGANDIHNLQSLCSQHNRHKYRKESSLR